MEGKVPGFCTCCGAPYHPATGGIHDAGLAGVVVFCGACEREAVKYMVHAHKRTVKVAGRKGVRIPFYS